MSTHATRQAADPRPYDPAATYRAGDRISHPSWGVVEVYKAGPYRLEVALRDHERYLLHRCSKRPEQLLGLVQEVWSRGGSPRDKGLLELSIRCNDFCDLLSVPGPGVSVELAQLGERLAIAIDGLADLGPGTHVDELFRELWKELARIAVGPLQKTAEELAGLTLDQVVGIVLVYLKWNEAPAAYRALAIWAKAHGENPRFLATGEIHGWTAGGARMLLRCHSMRRSPEMLDVLGSDWCDEWI